MVSYKSFITWPLCCHFYFIEDAIYCSLDVICSEFIARFDQTEKVGHFLYCTDYKHNADLIVDCTGYFFGLGTHLSRSLSYQNVQRLLFIDSKLTLGFLNFRLTTIVPNIIWQFDVQIAKYLLTDSPHDLTMFFGIVRPIPASCASGRHLIPWSDLRTIESSASASSVQRVSPPSKRSSSQ